MGQIAALAAVVVVAIVAAWFIRGRTTAAPTDADFVGSAACARCHANEYAAWQSSQHAVAMQHATPRTVLGRFDGARLVNAGVAYTFFRRGDTSIVNTIGADGAAHDYPIQYTFGVWPLQQYLVQLGGGRVQALLVAWDARPASAGGQRWFSLTPGVEAQHTERFHWTGAEYNWNYMCADCHSTAVRKGYVADSDAFHTRFAEISVGCEACHGPGRAHVAWARYPAWLRRVAWRGDGLPNALTERAGVRWTIDSATGNARRSAPRATDREITTCAQCHGRRTHIADGYTAGAPFMNYYAPLLLMPGMYYPDGQQRDEDYNWGSFLQSKMYAAGVTCADCHDPHTGRTRRPGNALCAQCHLAAKYDTPAHTHHQPGGAGAQCVACHMPDTAYMQIDPRRDHSLRVPRPDLSVSLGVPNPCTRCHVDHDARWAAAALRTWFPTPDPGIQHFAYAFAYDDAQRPGAADSLQRVLDDPSEPWIARASALARLGAHPGQATYRAAARWARDGNPVVRLAALQAGAALPDSERAALAVPLLSDTARAVRQQAAWLVAPSARGLSGAARTAFQRAAADFVASERYNADRAPDRLTLASFYGEVGEPDSAAVEIRAAGRLDSSATAEFVAALRGVARTNAGAAAMVRALDAAPR